MLISSARLPGYPVLSLHVGGPVARIVSPIVDPHSLRIIGYRVDGPLIGREAGEILPESSIRDFAPPGIIIDSTDELVNPDDIIRISEVLELHFDLVGLKVVTKKGTKLGKVANFTFDSDTGEIMQLIVQRPAFKAFIDPELTISRSEIVEVDDYKVTIKDEEAKIRKKAQAEFVPNFVNPFREPDFATETQIDE